MVVVGVGTAITVDVISGDGVYVGGSISPGLRTAAWSLAARTSLLPEVVVQADAETVPKSTEENINTGVVVGTGGAIDRLVMTLSERSGLEDYDVILSGGDSRLIGPVLRTDHQVMEDLVLQGLAHTYARMVSQPS